jgi:DNA polymerase I-like protein with 3'-5' exonuclease and polymerase domains
VPEEELDQTVELVVNTMENAYELSPKLRANAKVGQNWQEMTEIN